MSHDKQLLIRSRKQVSHVHVRKYPIKSRKQTSHDIDSGNIYTAPALTKVSSLHFDFVSVDFKVQFSSS